MIIFQLIVQLYKEGASGSYTHVDKPLIVCNNFFIVSCSYKEIIFVFVKSLSALGLHRRPPFPQSHVVHDLVSSPHLFRGLLHARLLLLKVEGCFRLFKLLHPRFEQSVQNFPFFGLFSQVGHFRKCEDRHRTQEST